MSLNRLKVVSIAHSAVTRPIGRIRYERLLKEFPEIELTLIVPDRWKEYGKSIVIDPTFNGLDIRLEPVRLQSVPRAGWYLHYYPRLSSLLAKIQPDVIHLWEEPWSLVALQAARLRHRLLPRSALVIETDQNILRRLPFPFEKIRHMTLRQTDLLIGRQKESIEVSNASGFVGAAAIVEYGVDRDVFYPETKSAKTVSPIRNITLGYVGRIVREKGLHDVLHAMAQAACNLPENVTVSLFVLGDGPDRDALEVQAAQLGLTDRIRFFVPRSPNLVANFMRDLDILVLMSRTTPNWKEQFGRVIMEAQACGTPVIGSSSGAIPGVVGSGGWIVEEGNAKALAQLICNLAEDSSAIETARSAGLDQAENRFSFNTVARSLGKAFIAAALQRREAITPI